MSDPRAKLGVPAPTDPITGLPKEEKSETIIDFAERHGWSARHYAGGYYNDWRLVKGTTQIVDLHLWPSSRGRAKGSIAIARANGFDIRHNGMTDHERRRRVEAFLAGTPCICKRAHPDSVEYGFEDPDPLCAIHGNPEQEQVAEVRGIDVEQATQEALGI